MAAIAAVAVSDVERLSVVQMVTDVVSKNVRLPDGPSNARAVRIGIMPSVLTRLGTGV